jgi:hypothetical protein
MGASFEGWDAKRGMWVDAHTTVCPRCHTTNAIGESQCAVCAARVDAAQPVLLSYDAWMRREGTPTYPLQSRRMVTRGLRRWMHRVT